MKTVHFATMNKGKVLSISNTFSKFGIDVVHVPLEISEPRSDDLSEIASHKVHAAFDSIKKPVIALDAGFYVHSVGGFPRTFVNFALKTIGINGILKLVEGKDRSCEFRNCLAFLDGNQKEPLFFEDAVKGSLAPAPRGSYKEFFWSDLFYVFIPEGKDKTLAEMSAEEFFAWRESINKDSYLTRFAEWFVKK